MVLAAEHFCASLGTGATLLAGGSNAIFWGRLFCHNESGDGFCLEIGRRYPSQSARLWRDADNREGIWGWPPDRNNALKVLKRAVELGVNLIDTADAYGPETSELLIAEALYPYPKGSLSRRKAV